jgi:hypothetical protein
MEIEIKLKNPISGYWDGGKKDHFVFTPESELYPVEGQQKWGCYEANNWFRVKIGKTDKLSVKYAMQHLKKFIRLLDTEYVKIK